MKLLYLLFSLSLVAVQSSPAQTQTKIQTNQWMLYNYLKAEGPICHLYFTIEDSYDPSSIRSILYAIVEYKEITSSDNLIAYLRQQLPDATISIRYKGVVSIIKTPLLIDKNYALNKLIACDYEGTNYNLVNYLNPLVGNSLLINNQFTVYEHVHVPIYLHLSIHTKKEMVRSVLTKYLPLSHISTILWTARTMSLSGKQITYIRPAGWWDRI